MIDFSQFDSFIAMYFNNEAVCRNAVGIQEKWLNQSDSAKCSIPLLD